MDVLLDSNIIIYLASDEYDFLTEKLKNCTVVVSGISIVEVLGYHKLEPIERTFFEEFFNKASVLTVSPLIIRKATKLRQQHKMSLGDALIAATALVNELILITRNTEDFEWIKELNVINPFVEKQ